MTSLLYLSRYGLAFRKPRPESGRIERVLDAAKALGYRSGENPARWRGHLEHLLPKRNKSSIRHHAALPYPSTAALMADLLARGSMSARALAFTISYGCTLSALRGQSGLHDRIRKADNR